MFDMHLPKKSFGLDRILCSKDAFSFVVLLIKNFVLMLQTCCDASTLKNCEKALSLELINSVNFLVYYLLKHAEHLFLEHFRQNDE